MAHTKWKIIRPRCSDSEDKREPEVRFQDGGFVQGVFLLLVSLDMFILDTFSDPEVRDGSTVSSASLKKGFLRKEKMIKRIISLGNYVRHKFRCHF